MKSKRAKEYMNRAQMYGSARKQAEKAVERAEEDARERAVKATCRMMDADNYCELCGRSTTAEMVKEFLKYYDNEN